MIASDSAESGRRAPRVVRIFQSYGWHDATEVAQRLKASLAEAGYEVWLDREQLRSDDKHFSLALEDAVTNCEIVVALLSPHSVRGGTAGDDRSSICYNEIRLADELLRPIVPVRVRKFPGPPPFLIIKYRRIDWLDWDDQESYERGVGDIIGTIERILNNDTNFDRDIAFQATNFASQLKTAQDDFVGRDWLFSRLEAWLDGSRRSFLIEGASGNGKTAAVAELVRRNPGGRILAYHFCSSVPVTLEPSAFVKSIAGMLAHSIDAYAEQLWNAKLAERFTADPKTMLSQGVLAPLHSLRMATSGYIIVDGLDEAIGADADPAALLLLPNLLAEALKEFPSWLKLVVTSRPHAHIKGLFGDAETCVLGGTVEDQRMDLRSYVERRLSEPALRDVIGSDAAARDTAIRLIVERGDGSFQYAGSVIDALRLREIGIGQLDQLPRSVEAFYYRRIATRFGTPPGNQVPRPEFRVPRLVLESLLAAREPLTLAQLATLCGLAPDVEFQRGLDALSGFVGPDSAGGKEVYRIAHKSIADWIRSPAAAAYAVDPEPAGDRILAHCRQWQTHRESYAMKHLVAHLIERGALAEALQAIAQGLFAQRLASIGEPRLDAEDSRNLALALVGARDRAGLLALATTENIWQRDGVAAALQSTAAADLDFVDEIVGALLGAKS